MSIVTSTRIDVPRGELLRLTAAAPAPAQRILAVEFRSPDGGSCKAIGGGNTVADAIDWARESAPGGTTWHTVSWNDLYGE